jgi:hypothetical protein
MQARHGFRTRKHAVTKNRFTRYALKHFVDHAASPAAAILVLGTGLGFLRQSHRATRFSERLTKRQPVPRHKGHQERRRFSLFGGDELRYSFAVDRIMGALTRLHSGAESHFRADCFLDACPSHAALRCGKVTERAGFFGGNSTP